MDKNTFPTEIVELPSQGLLYPETSPLHSGKVEIRYLTARDEDILTDRNLLEAGTVVDKLLRNLIVDKTINYNELLVGDKDALLVAARILGYGAEYEFEYNGKKEVVNLSEVPAKELAPEVLAAKGKNEFEFVLPASKKKITYKFLTHADEQAIEQELKGLRKLNKGVNADMSTRLKYMILSVEGVEDRKTVREFVDNFMLARDARAFRKHIAEIQPGMDMKFYPEDGDEEVAIPITVSFLWPTD